MLNREQALSQLKDYIAKLQSKKQTYSPDELKTLLVYYGFAYPDIKVSLTLTRLNWQNNHSIHKALPLHLKMILEKQRCDNSTQASCIMVPINIGCPNNIHEEFLPLLEFTLPGEQHTSITFYEDPVSADGNCAFYVLNESRNTVANVLLAELEKNPKSVGEKIHSEIQNALMDPDELHFKGDYEWRKIIEAYNEALRTLEDSIANVKAQYEESHSCKSMSREEFAAWHSNQNNNVLAELLKDANEKENALIIYCSSQDVIKRYFEAYRHQLWLGCESAILYAQAVKINLYIWEKERKEPLAFVISENANKTVHMLFTGSKTHFNSLVIKPSEPAHGLLNKSNDIQDQWILVGFRYKSNKPKLEEILYFDPRGALAPPEIKKAIESVAPSIPWNDVSYGLPYGGVDSGTWVVEIMRCWAGKTEVNKFTNIELAMQSHLSILAGIGALLNEKHFLMPNKKPASNDEIYPSHAIDEVYTCAVFAAVRNNDVEILSYLVNPTTEKQKRRESVLKERAAALNCRQILLETLVDVRSKQKSLIETFLLQPRENRKIQDLQLLLAQLAEQAQGVAYPFQIKNDVDLAQLAKELNMDLTYISYVKKQLAEEEKALNAEQTRYDKELTLAQNHWEYNVDEWLQEASKKFASPPQESDFDLISILFESKTLEEVKKDLRANLVEITVCDEEGRSLWDIANHCDSQEVIYWLVARGFTPESFTQAKTAILYENKHLLTLLLDVEEFYAKANQSAEIQLQLSEDMQECHRWALTLLHGQLTLLEHALANDEPNAITAIRTQWDALWQQISSQHQQEIEERDKKKIKERVDVIHQTKMRAKILARLESFMHSYRMVLPTHKPDLLILKTEIEKQYQESKLQADALLNQAEDLKNYLIKEKRNDYKKKEQAVSTLVLDGKQLPMIAKRSLFSSSHWIKMQSEVSINAVDKEGNTLCHYAAYAGKGEMLLFLLSYEPDLGIPNANGETVIEILTSEGSTQVHDWIADGEWDKVYTFLNYALISTHGSANLRVKNKEGLRAIDMYGLQDGNTLLHSVLHHWLKEEEALAKLSASSGPPLSLLKEKHQERWLILCCLLRQGADVLTTNRAGDTPWDLILMMRDEQDQCRLMHIAVGCILIDHTKRRVRGPTEWSPFQLETLKCLYDQTTARELHSLSNRKYGTFRRWVLGLGEEELRQQEQSIKVLEAEVMEAKRRGDDRSLLIKMRAGVVLRGWNSSQVTQQLQNIAKKGELEENFAFNERERQLTKSVKQLEVENKIVRQDLLLSEQETTELRCENRVLKKKIDALLESNQKMETQMEAQMTYMQQRDTVHTAQMNKMTQIMEALYLKLNTKENNQDNTYKPSWAGNSK